MKGIVTGIGLLISLNSWAQRSCATQAYIKQETSANPLYNKKIADINAFIQFRSLSTLSSRITTGKVIQIPVVVHVLYNTAPQNISDEQIESQIKALNRDYRRSNWDSVNTPDRFKNMAADTEIEFALATADTTGRATTGIVRKYTTVTNWQMDDKIKSANEGGDNAWDSKSYLNIWVGNMPGVLGYSSAPGGPDEKDGVVINVTAFGTLNTGAPYNLGRTSVHEIGHWLGLRHIWGDAWCGDDLVEDTPVQGAFTPGCPNDFRTTCSNTPLGDMYMNYMDFTDDACLNLFTTGQKLRMRALFDDGGPRSTILSSRGLDAPWLKDKTPLPTEIILPQSVLYPNPAQNELTLNFNNDRSWIGKEIHIISIKGEVVQKVVIASHTQKINVSNLRAGMYLIQGVSGEKKISEKFIKL